MSLTFLFKAAFVHAISFFNLEAKTMKLANVLSLAVSISLSLSLSLFSISLSVYLLLTTFTTYYLIYSFLYAYELATIIELLT